MRLSEMDYDSLTDEMVEKMVYSYPEDDGKNADVIFVFGSKFETEERIKEGISLYEKGRGDYLLLSGGSMQDGKTEAQRMKEIALRNGALEKDILLEEDSLNTTENVLSSLLVLEKNIGLGKIRRLIVVTNPAHMMRVFLTLKHYLPKWIECSYVSLKNHKAGKEVWKKDPEVKEKVWTEAKSMIHYAQTNCIEDFDFPSPME